MILLDTGCLAVLLLFSLVLPLMLSFRMPRDVASRQRCTRTVWLGQGLGAVAGLAVVAFSAVGPVATLFGILSCFCCALVLHRQLCVSRYLLRSAGCRTS
jgi:hypothetical protein